MNYVEPPDIPDGMTLREWRVAVHTISNRGRTSRIRRLRRWLREVGRSPGN